jgi:Domain of unknown function (DUF1707)/Cell wall-active antibiotics response 4TMS YvqF
VEGSQYASDREREEIVGFLRDDLIAGRLTLEEFTQRVDIAYGARTAAELTRARDRQPVAPDTTHRLQPVRLNGAVFGRAIRRGRMRLRRHTIVVGAAADVDFDLREAEIDGERVTVSVAVCFGNVDIYVPEGIDVVVGGLILFGRHRHWGRDRARPDAPTVRVRVCGCFGTADVWRVPRDVRGDYGEILHELEQRQRQPAP